MNESYLEKLPGIRDIIDDTGDGPVVMPRETALVLKGAISVSHTQRGIELEFAGSGGGGEGSGDVSGPATVVHNHLAAWNGTSGDLLKDSGVLTADVLLRTGTVAMTADFNAGGFKVVNAADAVAPTSLTTLQQVTALVAGVAIVAGFGLTDTAHTFSVDAADTTLVVGALGVKRAPITGDILIPDGSNVAAIAAGVIVDADVNSSAAIALSKLAPIGTATLLGRTTAGTGPIESLTLNATLSFSGATLQRAALTGDVIAAAGSNTLAIAAGVIVDADINSAAAIAVTKLAIGSSLQVLRTNVGGTAAEWATVLVLPAGSAGGQALVWSGSAWAGGAIDLADADAVGTSLLGFANFGNGAARSLFGRAANSLGVQASIAGAGANTVLVDNGTTLSFVALGLATLPAIATDSLLGRDTPGTGAPEAIALNATLSMTGAGALQRAALTGDVTAPAGSNALTITAGVITNAHVNASAGIAFSKLQTLPGLSVLGNASNATAAASAITGTDGQALVVSGTVLNFGQLNLGLAAAVTGTLSQARGGTGFSGAGGTANRVFLTTDGTSAVWGQVNLASAQVTGLLPFASIASIATSTLLGRTTAGTGAVESLTLNATLSFSGSTLQRAALTGDVTAAAGSNAMAIAAGVITNTHVSASAAIAVTKLENLAGLSVLARSVAAAGAMAAVTGAAGEVLRINAAGTLLAFGQLDLSLSASVAGTLPQARGGTGFSGAGGTANRVFLTTDGANAVWSQVNLSTMVSGQLPYAHIGPGAAATSVLGRFAGSVGAVADIAATADGQAFRRAGGAIGWGAIDLANAVAITNRLPLGNTANGTAGRVLVAGASDPAFGTALGNGSDNFSIQASALFTALVGADNFLVATPTGVALSVAGATTVHAAYLAGSRLVLGICGSVTTTQMPANTGRGVVFWRDASEAPTSGFSLDGGVAWNDATFGLSYKGKHGVETTLAPAGDSGNTTKRRMVGLKTTIFRASRSSGSPNQFATFDVANLNGQAITTGTFKAVGHFIAKGDSAYVVCGEIMVCVDVIAGVASVGTIKPAVTAGSATAVTNVTADVTGGTIVRLLGTLNVAVATYEVIAYWDLFEFEP